jgi:hypothetical protein
MRRSALRSIDIAIAREEDSVLVACAARCCARHRVQFYLDYLDLGYTSTVTLILLQYSTVQCGLLTRIGFA